MDKKDIYEHLAKIYLDASVKDKKANRFFLKLKHPLLVGIAVLFFVSATLVIFYFGHNRFKNTQVALVILPDVIKINFNFDPAKKEVFTLNLNNLNMAKYKALDFRAKRSNYNDSISLRVEFVNAFKERSEIYFREIPNKWQGYKVSLADLKGITNWASMQELSFIVEEWNSKEKNGIVYIDNVRFLR